MLSSEKFAGRMVGTEGNESACDYISGLFQGAGLAPLLPEGYLQKYMQTRIDVTGKDINVVLEYIDGTTRVLKFGVDFFMQSASDPIDIDLPLNFDLTPQSNSEAIHVLYTTTDLLNEKAPVLILAMDDIFFTPTFPYPNRPFRLCLTKAIAERIDLNHAVRAKVRASGGVEDYEATNVVGRIRGKDSSKAIVLTAHLDGPGRQGDFFFPGALDNASGVAALVTCAKHLSDVYNSILPETDIIFAAVNSEEYSDASNLPGSAALVEYLKSQYKDIYDINLDCIGMDGPFALKVIDTRSEGLNEAIRAAFDSRGIEYDDSEYPSSDHKSFIERGYAAAVVGQVRLGQVYGTHRMTDTADRLDYSVIGKVVDALCEIVRNEGLRIFDTTTTGSSADDARIDDDAWWVKVKNESIRILDGRTLKFDERIAFVFEGMSCTLSGWKPFDSINEARMYFPEFKMNNHLGALLERVEIKLSNHASSLSVSTAKPSPGNQIGVIEQVSLDFSDIFEVKAIFHDENRFREIDIMKAKSDPFDQDCEMTRLTGDQENIVICRYRSDLQDQYSSIRLASGQWWVCVREYTLDDTQFGTNNQLIWPVQRTRPEMVEWIRWMDIEANIGSIIELCGLDIK